MQPACRRSRGSSACRKPCSSFPRLIRAYGTSAHLHAGDGAALRRPSDRGHRSRNRPVAPQQGAAGFDPGGADRPRALSRDAERERLGACALRAAGPAAPTRLEGRSDGMRLRLEYRLPTSTAVGLRRRDGRPASTVHGPVKGAAALAGASPDVSGWEDAFGQSGPRAGVCFCRQGDLPATSFRARMFAPFLGVREDPATARRPRPWQASLTAHGGLGAGAHKVIIEQGREIGRRARSSWKGQDRRREADHRVHRRRCGDRLAGNTEGVTGVRRASRESGAGSGGPRDPPYGSITVARQWAAHAAVRVHHLDGAVQLTVESQWVAPIRTRLPTAGAACPRRL